jgi:hypothetical protein
MYICKYKCERYSLVIVYARLVAPEDDPLRLKHVVLDITIKSVALAVKLYMVRAQLHE